MLHLFLYSLRCGVSCNIREENWITLTFPGQASVAGDKPPAGGLRCASNKFRPMTDGESDAYYLICGAKQRDDQLLD